MSHKYLIGVSLMMTLAMSTLITTISASVPETAPSGVTTNVQGLFATYFQNMVEAPCDFGYVVSGFSSGSTDYGTKTCISMSGTLTSIYPTLFDVTWLKSGTNISYTGGNVGIGTATPTAKLEIVGFLKVTELGDYTSINIGKDTNDRIFADNTVAKSYGGGMWFRVDNGAGSYTDTMMLAENGNVGIGTTTPAGKLDVAGKTVVGLPTADYLPDSNNWNYTLQLNGLDTSSIGFHDASNNVGSIRFRNNLFTIGADDGWGTASAYFPGNVGIGTSVPGVKLDVAGQIRTGRDGVAGSYDTTLSTTTQSIWAISPTYDLNGAAATAFGNLYGMSYSYQGNGGLAGFGHQVGFHSNGTRNAAISLDNGNSYFAGNMGIGTNTPTAKLTVTNGDDARVKIYSNGGSVGIIDSVANTNDTTGRWLSINPTGGNVGIGTTTPSNKLHVNGNIAATGWIGAGCETSCETGGGYSLMYANGTIVSTTSVTSAAFLYDSDRRLKQNIVPLSNSLSKILSLNGYSFDWRKDGRHDIGVIAQEVEKVFPALVSSNSETGMKSVEYGNLVAPIIEAIKELVHKLDTFENSLNKQQSEIDILKTENARITTENTLLKNRLDAIEVRLAK